MGFLKFSVLGLKSLKHVLISACLTVALQILTKGKVVDNWYQLRATAHSRTEAGTIRIKARYMMVSSRILHCTFMSTFSHPVPNFS